jgi:hypothetical protein
MIERMGRGWSLRAAWAGVAAALLGTGLGSWNYFMLPGAERLDPSLMAVALPLFAVLCGLSTGLGVGAGTAIAVRTGGGPRRVGALRMVVCSTLGGVAGCMVPTIVGIAGFGSLDAPYAGTANLVFSILVSATTFVSLWAPNLWGRSAQGSRAVVLGRLEHLGISAMATSLAIASLGILGATLVASLGGMPSFDWFADTAFEIGLLELAAWCGVAIGACVGAAAGFACWLYLSTAMVVERRFR